MTGIKKGTVQSLENAIGEKNHNRHDKSAAALF